MARTAWWITALILCCWWVPAEAVLPVPTDGVLLRDSGELYYLLDSNDRLTLNELRTGDAQWRRVDAKTRMPRSTSNPLWLHVRIAAPLRDQAMILYHPIARQLVLDVYVIERDTVIARYETGISRPFASRPLAYRNFLFPVAMHAGQATDIYLRVRGYPSRTLGVLQLWPEQKLLAELPLHDAFEWANIGVMSVTAMAMCVVWLFVRERVIGLFALFVVTQLFSYLATRGYAFEWLWPNSPKIDVASEPLAVSISLIVNVGFSVVFLKMREYTPRLHRFTVAALYVFAVFAVLAPFYPIVIETIGVFSLLVMYLFLLAVSIYLFMGGKNRLYSGMFLLSSGVYMLFAVTVLTTSLIGFYSWWYSLHLIDLGQLIRILILAGCLGYRFRETVRSEESAHADARAKSEFLARMSHEIRTPMNGILGMSELLRDAGLNNTQRRYNEIVYASATSLLTIINDILDFSKIQAGRLAVENVPLDLHRLAVDALTLFRMKADEKNIEMLCDIRPNVAAWVMGDPTRIRQILINLLSNAIKFTEAGEIRLRISKNGERTRIAVIDTGPGIPPETQSRLFESFMQADASIARRHGGTGLGLAISLQLAELMGGKIGVQSQPGRGSTFWIELPLPATAKQEPSSSVLDLQNKCVLVVDDNVHFCELVAESVKSWGMHLHIAHSGAQALARVRELRQKNTNFDVISIDLKMPGMNGLELARALNVECGAALPPLLLLTATIDIPPNTVLREAGIVLAQEKPLLAADLREAFARALGLMAAPAPSALSAAFDEVPGAALTVLVVEDNPTNQLVIQTMLEKLGNTCLLAVDGAQAIAMYESRHADLNLILMDCDMPDMSGYETTRRIRHYEREYRLPHKTIIALTAHTLDEQIAECYQAGMDKHLAKPLGINQLRDFLAELNGSAVH